MSPQGSILVFHTHPDIRQMVKLCLQGLTEAEVHDFDLVEAALRQLKADPDCKNLILESGPFGESVLEAARQLTTDPQVIWVGLAAPNPSITVEDIPTLLVETARAHFFQGTMKFNERDFCQLDADLLIKTNPSLCDIWIRLSDQKYVKLFKAGTYFEKSDLEKLSSSQKIRKLFIKRTEIYDFLERFRADFLSKVAALNEGSEDMADLITQNQAVVQTLALQLGFSPEVQALARDNVQATLKMVGSTPRISQALAPTLKNSHHHTAHHSVALAHIACSIAALMEMPSQTTFHKLVLAALFHDFSLQDPHLAWKSDHFKLEELRVSLTPEEMQQILTHPLKAADAIRAIREIPGDVEFLVYQHHEKPDGSGYPKNLKAHQIVALSAVFIVAHELCNQIISERELFQLESFLNSTEVHYQYGTFKKIWKALKDQSSKLSGNPKVA